MTKEFSREDFERTLTIAEASLRHNGQFIASEHTLGPSVLAALRQASKYDALLARWNATRTMAEADAPRVYALNEARAIERETIRRVVNAWIDNQTTDLIADLTAALAASRPPEAKPVAGWKLVPVEPTPEMLRAATRVAPTWDEDASLKKWQAMLYASPPHPDDGAKAERAAIANWLRFSRASTYTAGAIADAIEQGSHLKGGKPTP